MLIPVYERTFSREFKKVKKRGKDPEKLLQVIDLLLKEEILPAKNRNHKLKGEYQGLWECHIEPDWLLVYTKNATHLFLMRTETHSNLFK